MAIEQLLGDRPLGAFMDEHYLRLPYAGQGGARAMAHLGDWPMLERLLAHRDADLIVGHAHQPWSGPVPRDAASAREVLAAGHTIGIRHAQRLDAALAELAADFQHDFAAPVDIHLYCTPAEHPGFGWHYDAEEVFVLQTAGSKCWSLRKNTVNPWPLIETLPGDMRYEREIMPLVRCTLAAGDWLYIPAGYWHSTAAGEESMSLSIGLAAPSGIDVYDRLRQQLLDSLRWRARLPCAGKAATLTGAELESAYREHCRELAADLTRLLADERFTRRIVDDIAAATLAQTNSPR